ncbi:MAG: tetratricopeptide repeat protein [Halothiobacillus sp.]
MPSARPSVSLSLRDRLWVVALLLLTVLIYWPGLAGGFAFDDFGNLVDNAAFAPGAVRAHFWTAVWSSGSGPTDRPISMLTFAIQDWFTGLAPWPLKFVNVLIHVANGLLIYLLTRAVLGFVWARDVPPVGGDSSPTRDAKIVGGDSSPTERGTSRPEAPRTAAASNLTGFIASGTVSGLKPLLQGGDAGSVGGDSSPTERGTSQPEASRTAAASDLTGSIASGTVSGLKPLLQEGCAAASGSARLPAACTGWLISPNTLALLVTAAWLLSPMQLTAVLYVIQRMESLASFFMLAGLWLYWQGRMRLIYGQTGGWWRILAGLLGGTVLAVFAKESGVMLPVYAFLLEWLVLRGVMMSAGSGLNPPHGVGGDSSPTARLNAGTLPSEVPRTAAASALTGSIASGTVSGLKPLLQEGCAAASGSASFASGINPRLQAADRRRLFWLFAVVLFLPGIAGLMYTLPGVLNGTAYASRPFDLAQRLWTEGRVLLDYVHWIIAPTPNALSLYHDDIALSTGWFAPWTTAASWALIAGLIGAALWLKNRAPLFALGVLWFFAGHALVSTYIPLELVYEHRNYLPSWGVFIALFGLIFAWQPKDAERRALMRTLTVSGVLALIALYAGFTALRAHIWGNPYRLAYFESTTHPDSPRASYELARVMMIMAPDTDSPMFQMGFSQMENTAKIPGASIQADQALIFMAAKNRLPVQTAWWNNLRAKIARQPMSAEDVSALYSLINCGTNGVCKYTHEDIAELGQALQFAVTRHPKDPGILTLLANYSANISHDFPLAYTLMQQAVALDPKKFDYWKNLVTLQTAAGKLSDARAGIERMGELNGKGIHDAAIAGAEGALEKKEAEVSRPVPSPTIKPAL